MSEREWTQERLQRLIDDRMLENPYIDFKQKESIVDKKKAPEKIKEGISIHISAMANNAGGTVIYGIKESKDRTGRTIKLEVDPITPTDFPKDTLEDVIDGAISPPIPNVVVHEVAVDGGVVYVVEVPKGDTAHQAKDKIYYQRYNSKNLPMNDSQIRDVMNRLKHPNLELRAYIHGSSVRFIIANNGIIKAEYWVLCLEIHRSLNELQQSSSWRRRGEVHYEDTVNSPKSVLIAHESNKRILPQMHEVLDFKLRATPLNDQKLGSFSIIWRLHADNMTPQKGKFLIGDLDPFPGNEPIDIEDT